MSDAGAVPALTDAARRLAMGCPAVVDGRADVERLCRWAFREGRALSRGGVSVWPSFGTSAALMERYGRIGCSIDGGVIEMGSGLGVLTCGEPHALAVMVGDAATACGDGGGYVAAHAFASSRPDWMPAAKPRWEPFRKPNGKVVVEISYPGRRPLYCPVRLVPSPHVIIMQRMEWLAWYDSLVSIAETVSRRSGLDVQTPAFPREPWPDQESPLTLRRKFDTKQATE